MAGRGPVRMHILAPPPATPLRRGLVPRGPKLEGQEVCPACPHHLIYPPHQVPLLPTHFLQLGPLPAYPFLCSQAGSNLFQQRERCAHTHTHTLTTSLLAANFKSLLHSLLFNPQTWSCHMAAPNPSQALLELSCLHPNSCAEALMPNVMVSGGGPLGR